MLQVVNPDALLPNAVSFPSTEKEATDRGIEREGPLTGIFPDTIVIKFAEGRCEIDAIISEENVSTSYHRSHRLETSLSIGATIRRRTVPCFCPHQPDLEKFAFTRLGDQVWIAIVYGALLCGAQALEEFDLVSDLPFLVDSGPDR